MTWKIGAGCLMTLFESLMSMTNKNGMERGKEWSKKKFGEKLLVDRKSP